MRPYSILQLFLFFSLVKSQFPPINESLICPASANDRVNASGTATFGSWEFGLFGNNDRNTNLSWAMTVDEGSQTGFDNVSFPTIDTSIWIGQSPGINLYDGSNGFSACAFFFENLPINTIERGQNDDGSCYQTFSEACVTALTDQVANFAKWQTSSFTGGPYSNLTPPILGYVCGNIQGAIGAYSGNGPVQNAFPAECQPYFDDGGFGEPATQALEITSNTTDYFNGTCYVENSTFLPGYLLRQATTYFVNITGDTVTDDALYDNATRSIIPVLSVFMPPANNSRESGTSGGWATMTCLRATKFNKGSRVAPDLPSPTPVHIPHPLSKGAKVGIAIGVIVGVGLIAAAIWFFLRTKRRKANAAAAVDMDNGKGDDKNGAAEIVGKEKYEVAGDHKHGQELDSGMVRSEAAGTPVAVVKAATGVPEELEGQSHHTNKGPPVELQC